MISADDTSCHELFRKGDLVFFIRRSSITEPLPSPQEKVRQRRRPSCLYYTASWHDSLLHPELGQLTEILLSLGVDVIACSLPDHPVGCSYDTALEIWRQRARKKEPVLSPFTQDVARSLFEMDEKNIIDLETLALAGLSRGAFSTLHLLMELYSSGKSPLPPIALFAPLLSLLPSEEDREPLFRRFFPMHRLPPLFLSIGNNDERVCTDLSLTLFQRYVSESKKESWRSTSHSKKIDATLHIHPSIGFLGHGTPRSVFQMGAEWIRGELAKRPLSLTP